MSGSPIPKRLGILRSMAESISLGRLVAPRTRILSVPDINPSHNLVSRNEELLRSEKIETHVMNSAFIIPVTSWSPFVLSRRKESISSIKMIEGWAFRARLKRPATSLFDSPYHLLVRTDAAMLMKVAPDSFARAFANIVFPHPGGPKSRTPLGAPSREEDAVKRLGYRRG